MIWIIGKIRLHVFVDFFLQINADSAIDADDLVSADAGVCGNVAIGIGDVNVLGIIADGVMGAFDRSGHEFLGEGRVLGVGCVTALRENGNNNEQREREEKTA